MRTDQARIADIISSIRQIQVYVAGLDEQSFVAHQMSCDAVARQIEIIGEAASRVSFEFKQAHLDIPWRKMTDMRNVLIHQYEEVDFQQVWTVATVHVSELLEKLLGL